MAPMWLQDCCQLGIDIPGVFVQSLSAPSMDIESVTAGKTTTSLVVGFVCESCKFEVCPDVRCLREGCRWGAAVHEQHQGVQSGKPKH